MRILTTQLYCIYSNSVGIRAFATISSLNSLLLLSIIELASSINSMASFNWSLADDGGCRLYLSCNRYVLILCWYQNSW